MSKRLHALWGALELPGAPFEANTSTIMAQVNGALNAAPEERKGYMKYKIRHALPVAAAAMLLAGSVLAAASQWDALSVNFHGDTTPAQDYLLTPNTSVSDGQFTVTLESCVTDSDTAFVILTVKALTEEAKLQMGEKYFVDMGTFDFRMEFAAEPVEYGPNEDFYTASTGALTVGELRGRRTEDSQSFSLDLSLKGQPERVYLRFGFLPEGMTLDVPVDHRAESLTVKADVRAADRNGMGYQFTGAQLTPLTFQFYYRYLDRSEQPLYPDPVFFFHMSDGSIRTMSQLLYYNGSGSYYGSAVDELVSSYRFDSVQDPNQVDAVIVDGRAYPFDGGDPYAVEVDPLLYPFTMPHLGGMKEGGGPYTLSVRALCERLGGTCAWNPDTQSATLAFRGVSIVLTMGSTTALVDGEPVALDDAPELRDGQMAVVPGIFCNYWGIGTMVVFDSAHELVIAYEITP